MADPRDAPFVYVLELAGEDDRFAAAEARSGATGVDVIAPGIALAATVERHRIHHMALTHRASRVVGRTRADVDAAERLLAAAPAVDGGGSGRDETATDADGEPTTVAVRARDVRSTAGVSTSAAERALGGVLVGRGYAVDLEDPDRELYALFADDVCVLGWLVAASERGFGDRAPTERPFFQPGSMDPQLARALVNLALPGRGSLVDAALLDPMCGTGGVLLEAGLLGVTPLGLDAQRKMVRGARHNLRRLLPAGGTGSGGVATPGGATTAGGAVRGVELLRGDAARLPVRDGAVDAVVFDAPYGRQSKVVSRSTERLVTGALAEGRRVLRAGGGGAQDGGVPGGRVVVVGDRNWSGAATEAGLSVVDTFERRVHKSLTRHVVVCERA